MSEFDASPRDAKFTVIGGGAVGCAIAYHLAKMGKDVQLLERRELASQTSGQGAGLCGQLRTSVDRVRLAQSSVLVFSNLKRETGHDPGWRGVGSLRISLSPERDAEFKQLLDVASEAGLEARSIDRSELRNRFPMLQTEKIRSAIWCPSDGYLSAPGLTVAYARAAKDMGATICEQTSILQIEVADGAIRSIATDKGVVRTSHVINAAGVGAKRIAEMAGVHLPIVPVRHEYFVTESMPGVKEDLPVLRVPDLVLYARPDQDRLLLGGFEPNVLSLDPRQLPRDGAYPPLEPDIETLQKFRDDFAVLVPGIGDQKWQRIQRGWPTFTPDGGYLIGPVNGVRGLVMAAGCNAHGVSGSAGLAQMTIESMFESRPSPYVASLSPNRFLEKSWSPDAARDAAERIYSTYYSLAAIAQGGKTP